jgi:hypothetical protein
MADKKDWTIMVYLAGDNNLSEDMISALNGIRNAMDSPDSDDKINIVAVYDSGYPTVTTTHYKFSQESSTKPLDASKIKYVHPRREFQDRADPPEKNYIIDFVRWAVTNFEAENYALILSGHSDGIIGRTLFKDENPSEHLNLDLLTYILDRCKTRHMNGKKFALLGFDSCLMNMAEVGYQLRAYTDIIVASQGNVPTSGWSYEKIFKAVNTEIQKAGTLAAEKFATTIVREFYAYSNDYNIGGRSINISACDMSKIEDLSSAINELAKSFNGIIEAPITYTNDQEKETARMNALLKEKIKHLIHNSHYYSQTFMYEQAVDVADFSDAVIAQCKLVEKELELLCGTQPDTQAAVLLKEKLTEIKRLCKKISEAVDKYIFAQGVCGSEFQFSNGVSIFFPWTALSFFMVYDTYKKLYFSKDESEWVKFIGNYIEMTYRSKDAQPFDENKDYLEWRLFIEYVQHRDVSFKDVSFKDVSFKDVSFKDVSFKDVSFKDVSFKDLIATGDVLGFYNFFRRFRNHPIDHNVCRIKPDELSA